MNIILASASPRRMQLLSGMFHNFDMMASHIDETKYQMEIHSPNELVKKLSFLKGMDVFHQIYEKNDNHFAIISADTVVSFQGKILGKPKDKEDAFHTLSLLQGNSNEVYTGMTVILKKENSVIMETVCTQSTVYFKSMSYQDIKDYVSTGEPLDKAGSYAIQGIGQRYIKGYDGDFNSIVGLDTKKLRTIFQKYDFR